MVFVQFPSGCGDGIRTSWPLGYEPNELPAAPPRDIYKQVYYITTTYACQH